MPTDADGYGPSFPLARCAGGGLRGRLAWPLSRGRTSKTEGKGEGVRLHRVTSPGPCACLGGGRSWPSWGRAGRARGGGGAASRDQLASGRANWRSSRGGGFCYLVAPLPAPPRPPACLVGLSRPRSVTPRRGRLLSEPVSPADPSRVPACPSPPLPHELSRSLSVVARTVGSSVER